EDPSWCPLVYERLTTVGYCWHTDDLAALYLGRHRHRVLELLDHLLEHPTMPLAVLIELAFGSDPGRLRELVRVGLRSRGGPGCKDRLTAAAALALLDNDWSRRELLAVLRRSRSLDRTIEVRAALRLSRDPAARHAVDLWEDEHPQHKESPYRSDR